MDREKEQHARRKVHNSNRIMHKEPRNLESVYAKHHKTMKEWSCYCYISAFPCSVYQRFNGVVS